MLARGPSLYGVMEGDGGRCVRVCTGVCVCLYVTAWTVVAFLFLCVGVYVGVFVWLWREGWGSCMRKCVLIML